MGSSLLDIPINKLNNKREPIQMLKDKFTAIKKLKDKGYWKDEEYSEYDKHYHVWIL